MTVPVMLQLLLLIGVMLILTSAKDSIQVTSFRKSRRTQNGPVMCALDTPSNKISSSSLQSCSLACSRDATCASFNIKDSKTCDLYNYKVKSIAPISNCDNYQVYCCCITLLILKMAVCKRQRSYYTTSPVSRPTKMGDRSWVYRLDLRQLNPFPQRDGK